MFTNRSHFHSRIISIFTALCFIFTFFAPSTIIFAQSTPQTVLHLPEPGTMITKSENYTPTSLIGMTLHPDNPLEFDFIINPGEDTPPETALRQEALKMIRYFLAGLTVPKDKIWVNLSPYENARIITPEFGATQMGRDLLAQDYMLKQLTASLIHPQEDIGQEFWSRVYQKAQEQFGTTDIPINTFNKVWIVPDQSLVYEHGSSAYVAHRYLKIMLEEDYLALSENQNNQGIGMHILKDQDKKDVNQISSRIVREVVLPELEKEINEGKNFANLRQIYDAMILAIWYKQNLKESLLGQVYMDQNKTKGIEVDDKEIHQKIYNQYLTAFRKGVYNYITEEFDSASQQVIPRKYFSGGALAPEVERTTNGQDRRIDNSALQDKITKLVSYNVHLADAGTKSADLTTANAEGNPAIPSNEEDKAMLAVHQELRSELITSAQRLTAGRSIDEIKDLLKSVADEDASIVSVEGDQLNIGDVSIALDASVSPFTRSSKIMQMAFAREIISELVDRWQTANQEIDWDFLDEMIDTTETDFNEQNGTIGSRNRLLHMFQKNLPTNAQGRISEVDNTVDKIEGLESIDTIVYAGMGGSGVGGNMLQGLVDESVETGVNVVVVKEFKLPEHLLTDEVKEKTLFILSSFSGTTAETLQMGETLAEKGMKKVITIASGQGAQIGKLAQDNNWAFQSIVPANLLEQPREAYPVTGFLLRRIWEKILMEKGLSTEAIAFTPETFDKLSKKTGQFQERAHEIAQEMYTKGKIPVFVTDDKALSKTIALRSLQQIAEIAFLPTLTFSESEAEKLNFDQDLYHVISLGDVAREADISLSLDATLKNLLDKSQEEGLTVLEKTYGFEYLVTFLAYNLAVLRGIEPMIVPLITGDGKSDIPAYKHVLKPGTQMYTKMIADYQEAEPNIQKINTEQLEQLEGPIHIITTFPQFEQGQAVRQALLEKGIITHISIVPEANHNEDNAWLPYAAMGTTAESINYVVVASEDELASEDWLQMTLVYFLRPTGKLNVLTEDPYNLSTTEPTVVVNPQVAKTNPLGGIDFNHDLFDLQIKRDDSGVPLPVYDQPIANMKIEGFIPVIVSVKVIEDLPEQLGIGREPREPLEEDEKTDLPELSRLSPFISDPRVRNNIF